MFVQLDFQTNLQNKDGFHYDEITGEKIISYKGTVEIKRGENFNLNKSYFVREKDNNQ